jgi:predicted signal transduction protein with EAL and GGDEF domain
LRERETLGRTIRHELLREPIRNPEIGRLVIEISVGCQLIQVGSVRHTVGLGIGIAMIPHDGQSAEELVRKADIALYRAKSAGGSAMCFFAPEMDAHTLGSLRSAGVRLALDDFGRGYSSFYHLRNLPVDRIKIDRSFIETMTSEPESSDLVQAMLGLGHGLGMMVTAEGIEKPDQLAALLSQGCEEGQGLLFGKAIPAAAATLLLHTQNRALAN